MSQEIRIGLFFDGTANNMFNDKKLEDGSTTNVAKIHDIYEKKSDEGFIPLYEPGVGTRKYMNGKTFSDQEIKDINSDKKDKIDFYNKWQIGFASEAKDISRSMMQQVREKVNEIRKENPDVVIKLDVFGFSRGAAIGRDFINDVNREFRDDDKISVGYAGFFDTVESVTTNQELASMTSVPLYLGNKIASTVLGDRDKLNTNLDSFSADKVFHIRALDDSRHFYSFSSLKNENGNLVSNMVEIAIRGAHSDIGAGYRSKFYDKIFKGHTVSIYKNKEEREERDEKLREEAQKSGYDIDITHGEYQGMYFSTGVLSVKEERSNELGKVALALVLHDMNKHGISVAKTEEIADFVGLHSDLRDYYNAIINNEDISKYKDVVDSFVNVSGVSCTTAMKKDDIMRDSFIKSLPHCTVDERKVFYNNPSLAVDPNVSTNDNAPNVFDPTYIERNPKYTDDKATIYASMQEQAQAYAALSFNESAKQLFLEIGWTGKEFDNMLDDINNKRYNSKAEEMKKEVAEISVAKDTQTKENNLSHEDDDRMNLHR